METIRLDSKVNITLYGDLKYIVGEKKEMTSNGLVSTPTVTQDWGGTSIIIKKGIHDYPSNVVDLKNVKDLIKKEKITIVGALKEEKKDKSKLEKTQTL